MNEARVLIIGGGVIGLCTAYYAAQKGHKITIIDRNSEDHGGCSSGNAGMIVPSHFVPLAAPGAVALGLKWMWNPESPFWIKPRLDRELFSWGYKFWRASTRDHVERAAPLLRDLHLASRESFEELALLSNNDFGLVKRGLLMLCKTQHALDEEAKTAKVAKDLGIPAQVLDAKGTAALDTNVTMDILGSIYFPKDCHLTPALFMKSLRDHLQKLGVEFVWNTEVLGWEAETSRVRGVRCSSQIFEADEYVLAGGSWSAAIARDLQLNLPLQAGKGYSLTLPNPRQLPSICAIFTEARIAVTPMGNTLRFGGTMEMTGLNENINPVRVQGITKSLPKYYPAFNLADFNGIQPWRGLRPCSPDGLPYLGRTARYQNLTIATGHAMMGLSLGPVTGKLMAEIVSGEKASINIELLNPDRYA
jgi:D-amino-acid dehydrogenase